MPLNLQLGSVNAPSLTQRQNVPRGAGLEALGNSMIDAFNVYERQRRSQTTTENPEVAMNVYIKQKQQLDDGMNALRLIEDPDELEAAGKNLITNASKAFGQEATQAGVAKSVTTKIGPHLITAMNEIQTLRSQRLVTVGNSKLAKNEANATGICGETVF